MTILVNILIIAGILAVILFGLIMGTIGCGAVFAFSAITWSWLKNVFFLMIGRPTYR